MGQFDACTLGLFRQLWPCPWQGHGDSCQATLTHWGRVTHICVTKLTNILTNAGILLIWTSGTNFSQILIQIHKFSFKKMHLKMSSGKWRPFCLGLNVLTAVYCSGSWGAPPPCQRSHTEIQHDMKAKVSFLYGDPALPSIQYGFHTKCKHQASSITGYINNNKYKFSHCSGFPTLTYHALVMPYDDIDQGQHWLR